MTLILFIPVVGLALLLAGRAFRRRTEVTALVRVKCPARNPITTSKDIF